MYHLSEPGGFLHACKILPGVCYCRSQAGEDVVPTFTTSNDRMLLLLSSGQSGMLRIEDAERLQVELISGGGCFMAMPAPSSLHRLHEALPARAACRLLCKLAGRPRHQSTSHGKLLSFESRSPAPQVGTGYNDAPSKSGCQFVVQGFPEGYTTPCWPIQQPGIGSHRNTKVKVGAEAATVRTARRSI
jgi:hypothetical protein